MDDVRAAWRRPDPETDGAAHAHVLVAAYLRNAESGNRAGVINARLDIIMNK